MRSKAFDSLGLSNSMFLRILEKLDASEGRRGIACVILCLLAFYALPTIFVLHENLPFVGSDNYSDVAEQYLKAGQFESSYRPPVYPLVLAALIQIERLQMIPGFSWEHAALFLNAVCALATGALVYWIVFQLVRRKSAAIIALVLYLTDVMYQIEAFSKRETALYGVVQLLFVGVFLSQFTRRNAPQRHLLLYSVLGFLLAILHLLRPTGILMVGGLVCWALFRDKRRAVSHLPLLVFAGLTFLLVSLPWINAMYRMSGKVTIASSRNFGQGLYKGHNPSFFSIYPWIDVDYLEPWMDKMLAEHNVTEQQIDGYFRKVAFEYIQAEPAKAVVATALKMAVFFSPYPTPLGRATLVEEGDGIVLRNFRWRNLPIGLVAMCHTLLVWAGVALWMRFEKSDAERELGYLLIWTTLAFLVVYSLLYSELRYRLPIDLLLTIVAGQGFSRFLLDKR